MGLRFDINVDDLAQQFGVFKNNVKEDLIQGVRILVGSLDAMIKTRASEELKSTRKIFLDHFKLEEKGTNIWVFTVDKPAMWIEEGIPENTDMKQALLKGKKFRVIPFDWGKKPSQQTSMGKDVRADIDRQFKAAMAKKLNMPKSKMKSIYSIENNSDGTAKTGKLHSFNFGGDIPGKGNTPIMQGVNVYQSAKNGNVRRDIMTFRTVSSGPASNGKWIHPGFKGKKFLDEAQKQATVIWESEILPKILEKWK